MYGENRGILLVNSSHAVLSQPSFYLSRGLIFDRLNFFCELSMAQILAEKLLTDYRRISNYEVRPIANKILWRELALGSSG